MTVVYETDIAIVGGGPTGLYGTYCSGFRGLRTVLIESSDTLGGQVAMLYPNKRILDVAGIPSTSGAELIDHLRRQANSYDPTILVGRRAVSIEPTPDGISVHLDSGDRVDSRALVLTAGIGDFTPRRLPSEKNWHGTGVRYVVTDPERHRGEDVVVAGGGDSAVDWAHELAAVAGSVTLVHRRSRFRAHAGNVARLTPLGVRVVTECEIVEIIGDDHVRSVRLCSGNRTWNTPADTLVVALGFVNNLGPLRTWGLELSGNSICVDRQMRTSLDRVYAAGDISTYSGKVGLMTVGFGEVATAIGNAAFDHGLVQDIFPGHSTETTEHVSESREVVTRR